MTGPRRLWSGDWMAESAAARERMAAQRGLATPLADVPALSERPVQRPRRRGLREIALAAWPRLRRGRPRYGLRTRLVLIAVLAGAVGAGAMIGVEAATGAGSAATRPYLGVALGPPLLGQAG